MPPLPDDVRSGRDDRRRHRPERRRSTVPGGWRVEASKPGAGSAAAGAGRTAIAIDPKNPHSGAGQPAALVAAGPASVVSEPFVPNVQSSLTIQAFFRSSPADATVRVWIEGESGGQPYVRRSELGVTTELGGRAVRASDLPPGGLDSARLRFELMTPGVLWIDDLRVQRRRDLEVGPAQRRDARCWRPCRPIASGDTPTSPGWPARTGSGSRPASAWPGWPGRATPRRETGRTPDAAASALPSDRKLR